MLAGARQLSGEAGPPAATARASKQGSVGAPRPSPGHVARGGREVLQAAVLAGNLGLR
jgi:hypothetical protein